MSAKQFIRGITFFSDITKCNCPTPCSMVKYRAEVSYFEFPDRLASNFFLDLFGDLEKQRWVENILLFLTV